MRPTERAAGDLLRAVLQRVGLAGLGVAAREDDGLEAAIQLGQRNLKRHLHWVQAQGGVKPLLAGGSLRTSTGRGRSMTCLQVERS